MKRKRRTLSDLNQIRDCLLELVRTKGRMSLSELIEEYAEELCVRNTPSDRSLLKRQLEHLDQKGLLDFVKVGRSLVARNKPDIRAGIVEEISREPFARSAGMPPELAAIRAYALQLEEFSRALQEQIGVLVRMIEKAAECARPGPGVSRPHIDKEDFS